MTKAVEWDSKHKMKQNPVAATNSDEDLTISTKD